jgi:hypothetical protein
MLASAQRNNVTLEIRGGTLLPKTKNASVELHGPNDIGPGAAVNARKPVGHDGKG